ncbi:ELMO domain-containing protein 2-like [Acanthaster planci]|uniref:ELMO domain-containing protein 2-like n=1 Tax=Acanthaster planci TaxID=133434 RepID=A0A8B7Z3U0_ACAPL|nr:ELMO domain-containing protein 2-like [Acanthaster planci]XP_022100305.1 ELMO domain-containing protein 2-like [Acanthaster planci]
MIFGWFYAYFAWLYHRMFKWMIRVLTGSHELQRLCSRDQLDSRRTRRVESSLRNSKCGALRRVVEEDNINIKDAVEGIVAVKGIDTRKSPDFVPSLRTCLEQICGYRCLLAEVEAIRKENYQSVRQDHEEKLIKLWNLLMPDTPLENRISKQWGIIGFQGDDPATDFRGMGMLGLLNLIYFAEAYHKAARHVLSHSHHPKFGYSYAVVGINMTSIAYHLLQDDTLKTHLYNHVQGRPTVQDFHQIYCHIFFNFDTFWLAEKPRDIMEFSRVRDKYEEKLRCDLRRTTTVLKCNFVTED